MTPEDEEFNRIEMESHIKQEYVKAMLEAEKRKANTVPQQTKDEK
jgi:hypothetical protein